MASVNPFTALGFPVVQNIPNLLPGHVYNTNTGVDLTQFHYFKKCPGEVRNMIYKFILVSKKSIQICSPLRRKRGPPGPNFASLLLVDKATHAECRGLYYTLNTFAVGNNYWGSKHLANLHGLREFMKVAPKQFLSQIETIEINVCADQFTKYTMTSRFYYHRTHDGHTLKSICWILLEHFRSLKTVIVKHCRLGMRPLPSGVPEANMLIHNGDWEAAGDALRILVDGNMNRKGDKGFKGLSGLKRFWFYEADAMNWNGKRDNPNMPGLKDLMSFADYVQRGRKDLENYKGERVVWTIADGSMGLLRRYEMMGLK